MSTAEINKKKLDLISWVEQIEDSDMLSFLQGLKQSVSDAGEPVQLTPQQEELIERGIKDADSGNVISTAEFWNSLKNE
jgi:hypothetical protein